MGNADYAAALSNMRPPSKESLLQWLESFLVPYYLTVMAVLGLATVGFFAVIGLLILVAANFNVLSLIE